MTVSPHISIGGHHKAPLALYKGRPAVVGTRITSYDGTKIVDYEASMIPNMAETYLENGWEKLRDHPEYLYFLFLI